MEFVNLAKTLWPPPQKVFNCLCQPQECCSLRMITQGGRLNRILKDLRMWAGYGIVPCLAKNEPNGPRWCSSPGRSYHKKPTSQCGLFYTDKAKFNVISMVPNLLEIWKCQRSQHTLSISWLKKCVCVCVCMVGDREREALLWPLTQQSKRRTYSSGFWQTPYPVVSRIQWGDKWIERDENDG